MALLRKVLRLAYDVILSIVNGRDKGGSLSINHDINPVAHSHGVGTAYAFQPEIALYLTFYHLPVIGLDGVPRAGVLDDNPVH